MIHSQFGFFWTYKICFKENDHPSVEMLIRDIPLNKFIRFKRKSFAKYSINLSGELQVSNLSALMKHVQQKFAHQPIEYHIYQSIIASDVLIG